MTEFSGYSTIASIVRSLLMMFATSFSAVGRSTSYFARSLSTIALSVVSVFRASIIKAAVGTGLSWECAGFEQLRSAELTLF